MDIFTREFKTFLISNSFCKILGHKSSKWENTYWALGHMGLPAKFCLRCRKTLKRKEMNWKTGKITTTK